MTNDQTQRDPQNCGDSGPHRDLLNQIADQEAQIQIKSRLLNNMAYQIRTLSNAVIGFSDLLLVEGLTPEQTEYVHEISDAGYGLSSLVNEALEWTQVLSGNLVVRKTSCELSDIIERLEQTLSRVAKDKGLDYEIRTDPALPDRIVIDSDRLLRCLMTLIANAITYTYEGFVRVDAVKEENSTLGHVICFHVIDSGSGIDDQKMAHLFESHDYESGSDQGFLTFLDMGLKVTAGLSLTKHLVDLLGGTIEVQSQVGVGSTFSLRIPVGMDSDVQPLQTSSDKKDWQPTDKTTGGLLLVEDQQANRTVISLMLESLGVEVQTAVDGEDALEKIEQNSYSLILMDLKMPRMDGYETTRRLREKGIAVPIVALSAKVLDSDEHRQIIDMFDGFLAKPVDSRKLAEVLEKFIKGFVNESSCEEGVVVLEYEH